MFTALHIILQVHTDLPAVSQIAAVATVPTFCCHPQ